MIASAENTELRIEWLFRKNVFAIVASK